MNSRQPERQVGLRRLNSSRRGPTSHHASLQIHLLGNHIPLHSSASNNFFRRVYAFVRKIPRGRVVTYGQIARALGAPHGARIVGWAMRACDDDIPWHRVVNAQGKISVRPTSGYYEQRARLREEGVKFGRMGKIDLKKYAWKKI